MIPPPPPQTHTPNTNMVKGTGGRRFPAELAFVPTGKAVFTAAKEQSRALQLEGVLAGSAPSLIQVLSCILLNIYNNFTATIDIFH